MMPAAKHFDPILGVDVHIIQPPGPVPPVPIPHPHIGMILDPMDYVPFIGGTVHVFGLKRAQAGTAGLSYPHIPIGGVFIKPPGNESEIFMGSSTVSVDGDAFSYLALPVLSCQDIGIPGPSRPKGSPPTSLVLPTTVLLSIPLPVFVGGAPTISLMALGMRFAMAGLGKAFKKLKKMAKGSKKMKALSKRLHKAAKKTMTKLGIPPSAQRRVHKAICNVTGHPVDTVSGMVFTESVDFDFDGPIQLRWERDWYSNSNHVGELGHGWHHPFDMQLWEDREVVVVRMEDGRWLPFARPGAAGSINQHDGMRLMPIYAEADAEQSGASERSGPQTERREVVGYRLSNRAGVGFVFEPSGHRVVEGRRLGSYALVRVEDRCGNRIELERGYAGTLEHVRDSTGRRLDIDHDTQGRITTVWGPHPDQPTERLALVRYVYDSAGDLVEVHDAEGQVTRYAYRDHLLISETDRAGMSYYFEWQGEGYEARCLRTWGDGGIYGRAFRYEPGKTTWVDSLGGEHVVEYDDSGKVLRERDPLGLVATRAYDEHGLLIEAGDRDGLVTTYTYDELFRVASITEPGDQTTRFTYDEHDALIEVEYPDGSKRVREYDERGCMIGELEPDGSRWVYEVDERGLAHRDIGPGGELLRYRWSPRGELLGFEDASGVHAFDLDSLGRTVRERLPDGQQLEHRYDALGRLLETRSGSGELHRVTLDPEGRIVRIEDALGHVEQLERDPAGRELRRIDPDGRVTLYEWDTENRLLAMTEPSGRAHRFEYDAGGRTASTRDPIGLQTEFERDAAGRVLERRERGVNGSLRWHRYAYDECGRLAQVETSDGCRREIGWDALDRIVSIEAFEGEAEAPSSSVERVYDRRGKLVRERIGELELCGEWSGDDLLTCSYPEGRRVEFELDHEGCPTRLAVDGRELASWSYDQVGRELERRSPGLIARRSWVGGGRLSAHWLEAQGDTLDPDWRRDYEYDLGARTLASHDRRHGSERYQVGPSGELWRAQRDGALLELLRDADGNFAGTPASDGAALGVTGALAHGYRWRWDGHGRLVEKTREDGRERWKLRWDAENHLVGVIVEDEGVEQLRVELSYDGFARLIARELTHADGRRVQTRWLWHGEAVAGERTQSWSAEGAPLGEPQVRDFVLDPGSLAPLAILEGEGEGGGALLIECDQVQAARAAIDEQGAVVWAPDFDVLGRSLAAPEQLARVPFRFAGQREDPDTGLYYNHHRWYDPDLGAYLSPDPIGLDGGPHPWNFVGHPLDAWDLFGLFGHNDPGHYVYGLYDPSPPAAGQKPYYVGITNNMDTRTKGHQKTGRLSGDAGMHKLDGPVTYGKARGYEQAYIEAHKTKTGTPRADYGTPDNPLQGKARGNRINSFDVNNKTRPAARQKAFMDARAEKLKSMGLPCS